MQRPFTILSAMLVLIACSGPFDTPQTRDLAITETQLTSESLAEVDSQEMVFLIREHEQARDVIVAHVAELADLPLPSGEWRLQDQTPQNPDEGFAQLFTKGPWVVQVSAPAISTGPIEYSVVVDHMSAIIRWEGGVDSYGNIVETNFIQGTQPMK